MIYQHPASIVIIFIQVILAHGYEPYLKVHIFPVGEGDATVIECSDMVGNITLTLVNAGSINARKGEIQIEYFKFLETKLNNARYNIRNIILTNNDPKHYNFIEPLMIFIKEEDVQNIKFYVGGERNEYISLDYIFQKYDNVFEFSRETETNGKISSCGHFDEHGKFYTCFKRNKRGPIKNSDQIIQICDKFQITIMAANYASSNSGGEDEPFVHRKGKNSLILKITPSGRPSPSLLLGDIGNDWEDKDISDKYYNYIKGAHSYYYSRSPNVPLSLTDGLISTVIKIPKNGALTTATLNELFYSDFVQPEYAIISSDITDSHGHPRCSVLRLMNTYMMKYSARQKRLQCHKKKPRNVEDIQLLDLSDNLYQTSIVAPDDFPHGEVQFNLITLKMTRQELRKPVSRAIYHILNF